jgi:ligand-binding sensor domain-containing protein
LLIDSENTLWVGTDDLLYRWSDAGHEKPRGLTFDPQGSNVRGVLSLALDDRGRVWASGTEGVAVWGRE